MNTFNCIPRHSFSRQQGIGLTELMIAMALALFLLLGLGTTFYGLSLTNKRIQGVPATTLVPGTAINSGLSGLQDSERMTMLFLGSAISAAGYYPANVGAQFPFAAPATGFSPNQTLSGTSGASPGTDSIAVRFESDMTANQGWQGCGGQAAPTTIYADTFSVANNMLQCTENGTLYPLVNGVASLTILYGLNTPGGFEYLPASSVSAWSEVKSINVTAQFVNPVATIAGQPATVSMTQTFVLMNGI